MQIVGYALATAGLLYYSLGAETVHAVLKIHAGNAATDENLVAGKRRRRRTCALTFLVSVILAGAVGGIFAGYKVEMDPRVYWYSKARLPG